MLDVPENNEQSVAGIHASEPQNELQENNPR